MTSDDRALQYLANANPVRDPRALVDPERLGAMRFRPPRRHRTVVSQTPAGVSSWRRFPRWAYVAALVSVILVSAVVWFMRSGERVTPPVATVPGPTTTIAPTTSVAAALPPLKIMPAGDFITQTTTEPEYSIGNYRCYLDHLLREAGVSFDFVGSQWVPHQGGWVCPWEFDHDHEAYWQRKLDDLMLIIPPHVGRLQPDVVLLHLGSADLVEAAYAAPVVPAGCAEGYCPPDSALEVADELAALIRLMQEEAPEVTIFVAQIQPRLAGANTHATLALNDLIASFGELSTETSSVHVVDMVTGFPPGAFQTDGTPNELGAELMAQRWMDALRQAGLI
jgi:hypothetical protein